MLPEGPAIGPNGHRHRSNNQKNATLSACREGVGGYLVLGSRPELHRQTGLPLRGLPDDLERRVFVHDDRHVVVLGLLFAYEPHRRLVRRVGVECLHISSQDHSSVGIGSKFQGKNEGGGGGGAPRS